MMLNWITDEAKTVYAQPWQYRFVLQQHGDLRHAIPPLATLEFERTIVPFWQTPLAYAHRTEYA